MLGRALIAVSAFATSMAPAAGEAAPAPRLDSSIEDSSEELSTPLWAALFAVGAVIGGALILSDGDDPVSP